MCSQKEIVVSAEKPFEMLELLYLKMRDPYIERDYMSNATDITHFNMYKRNHSATTSSTPGCVSFIGTSLQGGLG